MYTISYVPPDRSVELSELTVGGLLAQAAADSGDRVALIADLDAGGRREWTYSELHAGARLLALALLARFEPGEHVAIWMPNCAEWVLLELAAGHEPVEDT